MLTDVVSFINSLVTVHTTPEAKFENRFFTLKTHQMISVHTTLEEFKNATITSYLEFVLEENKAREIS